MIETSSFLIHRWGCGCSETWSHLPKVSQCVGKESQFKFYLSLALSRVVLFPQAALREKRWAFLAKEQRSDSWGCKLYRCTVIFTVQFTVIWQQKIIFQSEFFISQGKKSNYCLSLPLSFYFGMTKRKKMGEIKKPGKIIALRSETIKNIY